MEKPNEKGLLKMDRKTILDTVNQIEKLLNTIRENIGKEYFILSYLGLDDRWRIFTDKQAKLCGFEDNSFMQVRIGGPYDERAFYLSDEYSWELNRDSTGELVLIPTRVTAGKDESIYFNLIPLITIPPSYIFIYQEARKCGFNDAGFMRVADIGEYKNKAFVLSDEYSWRMVTDSLGKLVLIPERKYIEENGGQQTGIVKEE